MKAYDIMEITSGTILSFYSIFSGKHKTVRTVCCLCSREKQICCEYRKKTGKKKIKAVF